VPSPGRRPPAARVDVPVAIKGASFGFSVLVIGILLSALTQMGSPAMSTAIAVLTYVLAFFLAARNVGTATVPALHGVVAATVAYGLTLPLILRDPAGRNLTQISFTLALAVTVGALTGWAASARR
jgi:hypothetical protein